MTSNELAKYFNEAYGMDNPWPETYKVDAVTYANCCQAVFDWAMRKNEEDILRTGRGFMGERKIYCGHRENGLMFKNVELILDRTI